MKALPKLLFTLLFALALSAHAQTAASTNLYCSWTGTANFGVADGPAELPRAGYCTQADLVKSSGPVVNVYSSLDLTTALANTQCGQIITLQAGSTYTGNFTVSAQCPSTNYLTIRTSKQWLPVRVNPCNAGISSLPGRPAFSCPGPTAAKVVTPGQQSPITIAAGSTGIAIVGLEITRTPGTGRTAEMIRAVGVNHVLIDRNVIHGSPTDETPTGVSISGSSYIGLTGNYIFDFLCVSGIGTCTDSHAIAGGANLTNNTTETAIKVVNNFIEASGENFMLGGGASNTTPGDFEIRLNDFRKPPIWNPRDPAYNGGVNGHAVVVKNLFEVKNGQRILLEGNRFQYSWGGFSQNGYAVLLTPKNQSGPNGTNLCPNCEVTDVTIRYNTLSHLGAGMQIANAKSDNGGVALDGERYSIHDVTIDDIQGYLYNGTGGIFEFQTDSGGPLLQNVTIDHITAFAPSHLASVGDLYPTAMTNFFITNSILSAGKYPIWSTGGGIANCAYYDKPIVTFSTCFSPAPFLNNLVLDSSTSYTWPAGTLLSTAAAAGFANYVGGDYSLSSTSPFAGLGANTAKIAAVISGVKP